MVATARADDRGRSLRDRLLARVRGLEAVPPWRIAVGLYALSLLILLVFGFALHYRADFALFEADEAEYVSLSADLMAGNWQISPRRTLGFPILMAAIRSVTGNPVALQVALSALFALSTPALFALCRRLTGSNAPSAVAATLFAFWPSAVFYGTSLYSETAALPVFLAALALLPAGSRVLGEVRPRLLATLGAGAVLGIAAHVRPMYLLFLPILLLIVLIEEKNWRVGFGRFAVAVAGFALVVLPWSVYMSARFDRVIILTANGGETLAGGLTPRLLTAEGRYIIHSGDRSAWVGPGKWLPVHENGYLTRDEQNRPYAEVDGLLQKRALTWVVANPGAAAWLEFRKLTYMWGIHPIAENGPWQVIFGNGPLLLILAFSLALVASDRDARVRLVRLWIIALFVSGIALISWGSWRFRQPADAGLFAFVVLAWWNRALRRKPASPAVTAVPVGPLPVISSARSSHC